MMLDEQPFDKEDITADFCPALKVGQAASAATFQIDGAEDLVIVVPRNKIGTNWDKHLGKFQQAVREGIEKK